uniref:LRRCT domain-containing protein n=1 Tax=Strigamia maritima TaxID=126957 RepID=T1JC43_STRMM
MPNLVELNLSFNNITHNFLEFETNLDKLDILDLEHNNIIPWHKSVVKNKLSELDLGGNQMDFVTQSMLDDFNKVDVLDLHNNPFNCTTCQMAHFAKWLSSHKNLEMSIGIMCAIPENIKVIKMLKPPNCNA